MYTADIKAPIEAIDLFLGNLNLNSISVEESTTLGAPITLEELHSAIQKMNKGKAPGMDGIPPEVYI